MLILPISNYIIKTPMEYYESRGLSFCKVNIFQGNIEYLPTYEYIARYITSRADERSA